jgi:hypothetical protein
MADDPNSPAAQQQMMKTVYFRNPAENQPSAATMYAVDANAAVRNHPDDWSFEPWPGSGDAPAEPAPFAGVRIVAEWRDLPTAQRRALAMALGAPPDVLPGEADQFIVEEEKRRFDVQAEYAEAEEERAQNVAAQREVRDERGPVDIPDDWRDLPKHKRRMLAIRLGAPSTVKADEADKRLEDELARRKQAGPQEGPRPPHDIDPMVQTQPVGGPMQQQPPQTQPPVQGTAPTPVEASQSKPL